MRRVNPNIYDTNYYQTVCLGSEEFVKSDGKIIHERWEKMLHSLPVSPKSKILDVGCGRGDITLFLAKQGGFTVGIDYSKDAIVLANKIRRKWGKRVQKKTKFRVMDIKKIDYPDNYFDIIICIDVLEHLYKEEVIFAMREISRVLKKDGLLFVHTGPNRILYDITYPWYIRPINQFLTALDKIIKRKQYPSLPVDPRTAVEKKQHVNEPTYFYLEQLFKENKFTGKLYMDVGFTKPEKNSRSYLYNALTTLSPLSQLYPLNILFAWNFYGSFKNKKLI